MATLTNKTIASTYTSLLKLEGDTGSTVAGNGSNAVQVKTGDNDATPLYLNTDRVGVGGSASAKLHIKQDNSTTDTTNGLLIENDGTGDAVAQFLLTGTKRVMMGIDNSDSDKFKIVQGVSDLGTADGTVIAIDGSKNIAIGHANPDTNLHISGTGSKEIRMQSSDSASRLRLEGATQSDIILKDTAGGSNTKTIQQVIMDDVFKFRTLTDAGSLGIDPILQMDLATGNVGISTTSPTAFLTGSNKVLQVDGEVVITGTNSSKLVLGEAGNSLSYVWQHANLPMLFGTNNTERMRIDATGNIGIGTTSPTGKLEINGGSYNTSLVIKGSGTSSGIKFLDSDGNVDGYVYANADAIGFLRPDASTYSLKVDANSRISLSNNDGGTGNTVFGSIAGDDLGGAAEYNSFFGHNSGHAVTTGDYNVGIGMNTIDGATNPQRVVAIGAAACRGNLTSDAIGSVAVGYASLNSLTSGAGNTAIGYEALDAEDAGGRSTAVGYQALSAQNNDTGVNTALGWKAGAVIVGGYSNTLIGAEAGATGTNDLTSGIQNTLIGQATAVSADSTPTNQTVIGRGAIGQSNNSVTLGNSSVTAVYLGHDGNSATAYSGGQVVQGDGNVTMWKVVNYTIAANTELDTGIDTSHSFMAFVGATESDNTNGDTAIIACAGGTISTVATSQGFITVNSSTVAANRTGFYSTSNTLRIKSTFANGIDVSIAIMQAR